ncbi:EamA family transporter [Oceanobacillus polygoni]|uniref:Drug/metabolite transporter (DMT)-like permease n=1 Tax=Oceanobacillus polygoni TaxID=1235259 RepID=A0A9X1CCW9_9BACI|nr:DMT family transporter [Oceanobacillus polygoni]MBP2079194.1 drug/metabolite transporter (DMT)-like permease [Oceanobacillus polygoni]
MKRHHAIIIFSLGAFFFGLNPLFIKLGFAAGWSLSEINVVQASIAFVVLWIIGLFAIKRHPQAVKKLSFKTILSLMVAGSFTGLTSVLYYGSMQYLPASLAVVLLFQFVWVGVLFEWIIYRRKPSGKILLTVALTLVGVLFAADVFNGGLSEITLIGFLLGIGSAFTYSAFIIVSGRVAVNVPATIRSPIMVTGAALLIFILFPPHLTLNANVLSSGSIWIYAGALALCGLILTPLMFAMSTPHLPASLATILGAVELPVSVVIAYIGLAEYVAPSRWFGVLLILAAIAVGEMRGLWQVILKRKRYVH